MRYLFSIVIIIILFSSQISFAADNDSSLINYPDANLYYEYQGFIYSYNPKTKEKRKIIHGYDLLLSHDKTKFIYKPSLEKDLPPKTSETFEVYDIKTNIHKFIIENKWGVYRVEEWSPKDKYIIFDHGTDSITGKAVIYIETGNLISDFVTIDDRYSWINEDEILFKNPPNYNTEEVTEASDKRLSIVKLNPNLKYPESGKTHLVNTNEYVGYSLGGHTDALRYVVSINEFNSYPILSYLPIDKKLYSAFIFTYLSYPRQWVMIECMRNNRLDEDTSIYNQIFILNKDNVKSVLSVGDGYGAQW